jgi:hypothetical protein
MKKSEILTITNFFLIGALSTISAMAQEPITTPTAVSNPVMAAGKPFL